MVAGAGIGASLASGLLSSLTENLQGTIEDAVVRNTTNLSTKGFMPDSDVKAYFDTLVNTVPEKVIKKNFGDKYKKRLKSGYIFLVEKGPIGSWVRDAYGLGDSKQISESEWYAWLQKNGNNAMRLYMSMYPTPQIPDSLQKYTPASNTAGNIIQTVGAVVGSQPLQNIGAAVNNVGSTGATTGAEVYANYTPESSQGALLIQYMKNLGYSYNGVSFTNGVNELSWQLALSRYGDLALSEEYRRTAIVQALTGEAINRIQLQVSQGTSVKQAIRNVMSAFNLTDAEVEYLQKNHLPTLSYQSGALGLNSQDFTNVGYQKSNSIAIIAVVVLLGVLGYFIIKK